MLDESVLTAGVDRTDPRQNRAPSARHDVVAVPNHQGRSHDHSALAGPDKQLILFSALMIALMV